MPHARAFVLLLLFIAVADAAAASRRVRITCTDGDATAVVRVAGRTVDQPLCDAAQDGVCVFRLEVHCGIIGPCPALEVPVPVRHHRRRAWLGQPLSLRCRAPRP